MALSEKGATVSAYCMELGLGEEDDDQPTILIDSPNRDKMIASLSVRIGSSPEKITLDYKVLVCV